MKIYTIATLGVEIVLLLSSCASRPTPEGAKVREVDDAWLTSCTLISASKTSSWSKLGGAGNKMQVWTDMKNQTASQGGNAYHIDLLWTDGLHYDVEFSMYNCPETKYQISKKYDALSKLKKLHAEGLINDTEYAIEKSKVLESYK